MLWIIWMSALATRYAWLAKMFSTTIFSTCETPKRKSSASGGTYRFANKAKRKDESSGDSDDAGLLQNNVVHHASLYSLYAFGEVIQAKCLICSDIWSKVKAIYLKLSSSRFSDYRIECCWMTLSEEHGEQKMWFVMVNPSFEKEPPWKLAAHLATCVVAKGTLWSTL